MKLLNLLLINLLMGVTLNAQKTTISGNITDAGSGETLAGAMVQVVEQPTIGTVSNSYGFYSLKLDPGTYTLVFRYLGYEETKVTIDASNNVKKNVSLTQKSKAVKDVVITSKKKKSTNVDQVQMGEIQVDLAELEKIPVILGERDVLKSIQLLPGIQAAQEGGSGYIVRGGNTDENLILLDEAPVYNASHLLGFFSTFNSDAVKDMTIYKGNMPAEYGGRLSSVADIKMKEGNNQRFGLGGGIGVIASRLYLEGPFKKDRSSYFVSGRRTYADLFLFLSPDSAAKQSTLYFYDVNAKMNFKIGEKDRLYFSGYFGNDVFGFADRFDIIYGNVTATARWNHLINDKMFSNTSLIYNNFNYKFSFDVNDFELGVKSILNDYGVKQDFDYYLNTKNRMKFGAQTIWHNVVPGNVTSSDTNVAKNGLSKSNGWENSLYFQNEQIVHPKITLNYGVRFSIYTVMGPNTLYSFDSSQYPIDTQKLKTFQFSRTYFNPEPRISARFSINETNSIKAAYSRNVQNIHQISNTAASSPTDRWVLTTKNIRPGISDQGSVGYFFNFLDNTFEASVETYFKWMQNQIDYKTGAQLTANETVEKDLVYGDGMAYGMELFLKKRTGRFTGWISYTLSKSRRRFQEIQNNSWFNARYDRTHDLSVVAMFDISKKINIASTLVFYTGNAANFPVGKYFINGDLAKDVDNNGILFNGYNNRNADRMPNYFRMDFSFNWNIKKGPHWEHVLNVSIYNFTANHNTYTLDFVYDKDQNRSYVEKTYLFSIVPSVTYNFKFHK